MCAGNHSEIHTTEGGNRIRCILERVLGLELGIVAVVRIRAVDACTQHHQHPTRRSLELRSQCFYERNLCFVLSFDDGECSVCTFDGNAAVVE